MKMKFSVSNLLLLTALIAVLLGWFFDHRRLASDKERLNSEAAQLLSIISASRGRSIVGNPPDKSWDTYNLSSEADRAQYMKDFGSPQYMTLGGEQIEILGGLPFTSETSGFNPAQ
jgi:hypothetical protein